MTVLIQVGFKITHPGDDEDDGGNVERQVVKFRSRMIEILNTGDIKATLIKMADGIEIQIVKSYLSNSKIANDKIDKITFHCDEYNPARAGSYIDLPKGVSSKKYALILIMKINSVSNIVFNALF